MCITFWKRQNHRDKTDQWVPEPGGRRRRLTTKEPEGNLGDDKNILDLDCGGVNVTIYIYQNS